MRAAIYTRYSRGNQRQKLYFLHALQIPKAIYADRRLNSELAATHIWTLNYFVSSLP